MDKLIQYIQSRQFLKDAVGWGIGLWLIGYALGIILFMLVPPYMIGWILTPIGIIITLWVLFKKTKGESFEYYFVLAVVWTLIAIIFDYLFIVKLFNSSDYYKLDVYLYYIFTLILPLIAAAIKLKSKTKN